MIIEINIPDKIAPEVIAANAARFKGNRIAAFKRRNMPIPDLDLGDKEIVEQGLVADLLAHVKRLRMHHAGKEFDKELKDGNDN